MVMCTTPHQQKLLKDGLILRPASFRGQGKNSAKGNRGPGLYLRKYVMYKEFGAQLGERLLLQWKEDSSQNQYFTSLMKDDTIVGYMYVPKATS